MIQRDELEVPVRSDDILQKGGGGRDEQHWSHFNDRADRIS